MHFVLIILIFSEIYDDKGVLFNDETKDVLILAPEELQSYTIPRSTTTINGENSDSGPFFPCRNNLKTLIFSEDSNLQNVGKYCFAFLTQLTEIDMSTCTKLKYLSYAMFFNCKKIRSINLPPNIENIQAGAIHKTQISILSMPKSLLRIENWDKTIGGAIQDNLRLELIKWEDDSQINYIGSTAFAQNALKTFHITKSLTHIGDEFLAHNMLENITVDSRNLNFNSDGVFLFNKDNTSILLFPNMLTSCPKIPSIVKEFGPSSFQSTSLTEFDIPFGITKLGGNSFSRSKLVTISVPSSITTIGYRAFWECKDLANIQLEANISLINNRLFQDCGKLQEVIIPRGVTRICSRAFEYCYSIKHIFVPNTTNTIDAGAFANINQNVEIDFENGSDFQIENQLLYNQDKDKLIAFLGISKDKTDVEIDWRTQIILSKAFQNSEVQRVKFPATIRKRGLQRPQKIEYIENTIR